MKHFLDLSMISKSDLQNILSEAKRRKLKQSKLGKVIISEQSHAKDKLLLMVFEKPSTRTRLSFDIAMRQLGGGTIVMNSNDMHLGKGNESVEDTAKVISSFSDIVMFRTFKHQTLLDLSKLLTVPLINGLTNLSHPCQLLSDVMTFEEKKGSIKGAKVAWVGDGNNVANSAVEAAVQFEFNLNICVPKKHLPSKKVLDWAENNNGKIDIFHDPKKGIKGVDCIMSDKWVSMGDKGDTKKKKKSLRSFQINDKLMTFAKKDAIYLHVLPAAREEEVTSSVIDGKQSLVWVQAENRLHGQKAIIDWCLSN
ncbi:MAG: ornithine carbamoyltransferase [Candidatus Pelagibacter sp.]|nr:ornithine carbamoyltransferase [Candidatus Pelagibacter sp.]OUV88564.1 MAG: ornithine carbamoyltransferase [Pelagibacteraceae bacterium TMED136]|tara:strand:- start:18896 stop:19822 length:927 start_codon:yes stop_codon:yes gene_type:complete